MNNDPNHPPLPLSDSEGAAMDAARERAKARQSGPNYIPVILMLGAIGAACAGVVNKAIEGYSTWTESSETIPK